jgi:regulator of replication initiation timing
MRDIIGHKMGSDAAGFEQAELRQRMAEEHVHLRNVHEDSARQEIRQRISKLQEQLNNLVRLYGRKG